MIQPWSVPGLPPRLSRYTMIEPIRQDQSYHEFADDRVLFGIANAADTLSSLAFVMVGVAGLAFLWRERRGTDRFETSSEMSAYWILFGALVAIGFGSAYYHLAPDDGRLVWDRLPIAIAFMSLLAAVVAERVNRLSGVRLLLPLCATGVGSVLYWAALDDLRPYVLVQFGSMIALLVLVVFLPSRYTKGRMMLVVLSLYALAKFCELHDREIYELSHWLSGHTLKHLAAALAGYLILLSLQLRVARRPASDPAS